MPPSALVVGGGPAGSSAALGLLRRGHEVTLFDQRSRWTGRVCGAFLNPEAAGHLDWLGLKEEAEAAGALPVPEAEVTFAGLARSVATRQRGRWGLALPRRALEDLLLEAVRRAGGRVEPGVQVKSFRKEGLRWALETSGGPRKGDLLVLADGRFSLHAPAAKEPRGWYGWNASFEGAGQAPGSLSLHLYPGGYVGVMTFSSGESNVCGLRLRKNGAALDWASVFQDALEKQPAFRRLMKDARRTGDWRGVGPLPFSPAMRRGNGFFPVGDAAAVGDPFMGEGIGRALGAGPLLYECLGKTDPLGSYERLWKGHYAARLRLGGLLRFCLARPALGAAPLAFLLRRRLMEKLTPLFHI